MNFRNPITNNFLLNVMSLKSVFTPEECKKIINLKPPQAEEFRNAEIYNEDISKQLNTNIRNTRIKNIYNNNDTKWIGEKILEPVTYLNREKFKFNISYLDELHVLEYKENCFFNWHIDLGLKGLSTRKLSVIVYLSDPKDYEGGEFVWELPLPNIDKVNTLKQEQGMMVVFPAYKPHTVKPVKKGVRYTLVCWLHGDAFK